MTRAILTFLCLTVFATSASAECAWVLWYEDHTWSFSYRTADANVGGAPATSNDSTSWDFVGAYPTSASCENQQAAKISAMLKQWRKDKAEAKFGEHTIDYKSGSNIISKQSKHVDENTSTFSETIRYACLPDTVDPRGVKGGSR